MSLIGALSYALAAVAYLTLGAVLLAGWRGRRAGLRLVGAVGATVIWALIAALSARSLPVRHEWMLFADQLYLGAWIFALTGLAASARVARAASVAANTLAGVAVAAGAWVALIGAAQFRPVTTAALWFASGVALPLTGLVLLEQLYRNSHAAGRRALRPLFVGTGAMFVYDLFMYCEASVALGISAAAWVTRGIVAACAAPAIALAARRNPDWSLDVFVSRQVVFYSTAFVAVGLYLVAVSGSGYLMARLGGQWGDAAQLVLLAGAAVVLGMLAASGTVRGRLRVFLAKHFYRNKYDYRIEWLRFVQALESDGHPAEARPAMIRAVAQMVGSHVGTLWVRSDDETQLVPAGHWSEAGPMDADLGALDARSEFIEFLERRQWIVDVEEHRRTPELYQNLLLPESLDGPHDLRIFLPLIHRGRLVGLIGLGAPDRPFKMSYEDRDLLKTVGRHLGTHVAQLESDRNLTESRQFEGYSRLTAFLMHDLKNLVAQLSLVVANAERHRRNPAFVDDAIDTIRNSTDRMTRLIEQLQRGAARSIDRQVRLRELVQHVVERTSDRQPVPTLECSDGDALVVADPERLTTSLEHVVRNGQDATPADGTVSVRLSRSGDRAVIQVADTGTGMSADFMRHRLFRPFDSTKGSKGMGIGAYQVRDYVRSLRGEVAVSSSLGAGTVFSISLPVDATTKER
jgi:putative PEP-CTERM system histidine kinase